MAMALTGDRRLAVAKLIIFYLLLSPVTALTYWLHSSCLAVPSGPGQTLSLKTEGVFEEVFEMARLASERMNTMSLSGSGKDLNFARAYSYIFSDDPDSSRTIRRDYKWRQKYDDNDGTDTVKNIVKDTLDSIATEWEETETRVGSNVRFYCNDGEHYEYDAEEDEYFDEFNWVASDINCWSDGMEGKLLAFHTAERIPDEPEDGFGEDEGLDVSVITLCNHAFKVARSRGKAQLPLPLTIDDLMRIGRLRDGAKIDHFDVISHTIFHELMHTPRFLHEDYPPDEEDADIWDETGGWMNVIMQDDDKTAINADGYPFLAKLALMMEGNPHDGNKAYALDRIISEDPAQLEYGILRHYSSLTRRWFARALAWLGIQ